MLFLFEENSAVVYSIRIVHSCLQLLQINMYILQYCIDNPKKI